MSHITVTGDCARHRRHEVATHPAVTRKVMLAVPSPQCLQHSCAPHDAAAYTRHGHATFYTQQLQGYQQLLLQQIHQLQQQLASQHASTHQAPTPHCSVAATCASPASAACGLSSPTVHGATHEQQHQQQGDHGEWHGSLYCQHAVLPTACQHAPSSHRCQQALYAKQGEAGSLGSQESIQQKQQNSCQQQQQLTTYSSSCVSFPSQDHCASVSNRRDHSNSITHGPLSNHRSPGISRALFGSPTAAAPQPTCDRQKGQSCTDDAVYISSSSSSTAVASGCSGTDDSQKPADSAVADLCQKQQSRLSVAVGPSDSKDRKCPASADASLQTPELCTTTCWQGRGSGSSACNSKDAQKTSGTAQHAPACAAATPIAAPRSTVNASPARVQCLVEQLEQRLTTLQNLLHTPTVLDDSPKEVDAQQEQEVAAIAPAQQAGSGSALGYEQSDASDGTSAVLDTIEIHVENVSSSSDGDPGGVHVQCQSITEARLCSRQQCGSPAVLASTAAELQPAHQQKQGLGTAAIVQREPLACKQQGHQPPSHKQQSLEQQSHEQQEPWQTLPQSKGQHLDLSRGGAGLVKANACSDKLMFALLLASKKPVEC